ncbi:carboxypeptidase-like regulatory domain-containing protein [Dokdonia genika]|uniref:Carboxypeptidase-like regulatory domain-containing protein n=1 Tax=Dokdonia genika TaxID=308113 RepID=A0ABV9L675_9FLAO
MIKKYICFIFLVLTFLSTSYAQYGSRVTVKGKIVDNKTKRAVEFANIGFVGAAIGTVSDVDGNFSLSFAPGLLLATDKFQVSVIGYEPQIFSKNDVLKQVGKDFFISLKAKQYSLDEVIVGETKRTKSTVGDLDYDDRIIGYWKDIEGLGGEITTKIKIRRKNTKLHNLQFKVLENGADSLLVRVNVYDVNHYGLVGQNLLSQSIKHTISTKQGLVSIPLEDYGIYVHSNIIVGIELLKVYGRQIGFSLAGSMSKGTSFIRYKSQDHFKPVENTSMAFRLDVSNPARKGSGPEKRDIPSMITLYWDTSTVHKNRNLESEIALVSDLLKKTKEAQVDVVKFAQGYEETKTFYMHKGKAAPIISYLKNTTYVGSANFENLTRPELKENAAVILVTQGQTVISKITPSFPCPVFVVSSNYDANKKSLEDLALFTDGDFLDASLEDKKDLIKRYTHFIEDRPVQELPTSFASGGVSYQGKQGEIKLQGAKVTLQNSFRTAETDVNGSYRIAANPGDILEISFPGMENQAIKVGERGRNNVKMIATYDVLDEVILTSKKQEKVLVQTTQGLRNEDAVGYKNNLIDEKEITAKYTTLGQVLRREAGVEVRLDVFTRKEVYIFPRTFYNSIETPQPPIIVIDGVIYNQTDATELPQLDMQNVKSINTNSSLIATTLYGSIAAGGVIEIKTKTGNTTTKAAKKKASALATGNTYTEQVPVYENARAVSNTYKALQQGSSLEGSKEVYFNLLKRRTNPGISFYMDAYNYFKDQDAQFTERIVTSIIAVAPENKQALRTATFALQELGLDDKVVSVVKHIKSIAPRDVQSYLDLAQAYDSNGDYQAAFEEYKTILANQLDGVNFESIQETAENELRRLVKKHKSKVSFADLPQSLLDVSFSKKRRLVFEWSDPSAQFEIQFVNPEGKFFTWDHTMYKNQEVMASQLRTGTLVKEFELDDLSQGKWIINLNYVADSAITKTTPFLTYTSYEDYATDTEKKKVKIIPLAQITSKVTIDNFIINSSNYEN